ncbi:hypothetical protein GC722_00090 [Auraticoccus sp. F435]|uniref:Uncharacterized protein n=1 Tax=Auraticoccus cholistanensis TaxID=2656650 RepID=A0A6A9UZX6_9ACTN|nr:hypothetical protein [Auraticoccus cholistanensis]MVA74440.1 hypothetical protein [Auraticoccus cholistanensis]
MTSTTSPMNVSGVFPSLAQVGDFGPPRSELGIGSLMPWNGKLYVQNYNSHKAGSGGGVSLRRISEDLSMEVVPETFGVDGTYTNRFVHFPTSKLVLGPHVIDTEHKITTIAELAPLRVCGTARHLTKPDTHVYVLAMEGELFELDLTTMACTQLFDLNDELGTDGEMKVHYKDCYTSFGRLVICSNEYHEPDWAGEQAAGRLAEYDGQSWRIVERRPFTAIGGRHEFGGTIFATGWDRASAIMQVFTEVDQRWTRYRLPKASHCFDHKWQTEWPRIREVEHERLLMDHHGMFYEVSPWAYGGRVWGVRPISTHLWVMGDFCSWRGMLVLGADNASPSHGLNPYTAEPHSNMWFGKTDDLWSFGKPAGWGGPWWEDEVVAGEPSDPYLMTGFDQKCLHVQNFGDQPMTATVEVDVHGHGRFARTATLRVGPGELATHVFPSGFSAHWARVVSDVDTTASAQFVYT